MTPESKVNEEQEVVAWMTEDGERVITNKSRGTAMRDGGAIKSSVQPFSVPLARASRPITREGLERAIQETWSTAADPIWDCHIPHLIRVLRSLGVEVGDG